MKPEEVLLKYHKENPKWICLAQDENGHNHIFNVDNLTNDYEEWLYLANSGLNFSNEHEQLNIEIDWNPEIDWTSRIIKLSDIQPFEKDPNPYINFITKEEHDKNRLDYIVDFMYSVVRNKENIPDECFEEYHQLIKIYGK